MPELRLLLQSRKGIAQADSRPGAADPQAQPPPVFGCPEDRLDQGLRSEPLCVGKFSAKLHLN